MGCGLSNQVGDRLGGSPGGTLSPKRINPGYTHNVAVPSEAQRKTLDAILAGDMEIACPSNAKIVRIFTSSTFTDTQHERNALMEKVYPKLKAFCQERGYEFQVVDMRWGVRDEATDDHMATELCLKEVLDCKKVSTGPNFVTFLSHKYGYRPMPRMIAIDELDNVVIKVNEDERSLIERWYKKDTNHVPSMYVMQPVSRIIPDFITGDQKRNEEAKSQWWNVMQKLRQIFMRNVDGALKDKYRFSVTENEICRGILESSDAAQSTIWYHRVFHHITMDRDNPQLSRHVDTMEDDSSVLLNSLKNKLANVLPDRNIQTYNLKWSKKGFDPVAVNDHRKYIQQFCSDFEHQMQELVVQAISERVHFDSLDPLYEDIIQHVSFCQNKCEAFQGREDTLSIIESYIKNSAHKLPLVIHGPSGSGKTSIVAMAAKMTRKWTTDNTAIVIRFLGTTSASSSIRSVLYGLVKQINIIYKLDNRVPEDLKQLIRSLREQLTNASEERPLVIFLDSLDQLDTGDGAQQLAWLPTDLPNNVKIVLSTLPEEKYEYYPRLKTILPSSDNFVGVPELAEQDVQDIIQKWFSNENKTLTDNQMQVLVNTCQRCPIPLFLKISFVESCRWYSYSDMNETILQETVRDAIITLFERIEKNHGSIMVSRALGYITA
uniref:Leucine-rich repeat and WD repeat-containing protein KIAA1239-like n=1 Tax=Saccoglossus kowalevskii TaxID=10224 RepID=A0ABM0GQ48_SACKO